MTAAAAVAHVPARTWTPLSLGAAQTEVRAFIDDTIVRLQAIPAGDFGTQHTPYALYFLGLALERVSLCEEGVARLEQPATWTAASTHTKGLWRGFAQLGLMTHLIEEASNEDPDGTCEDLDAELVPFVDNLDAAHNYDLLNGVAGIGLYAATRPTRASAKVLASHVLTWFEQHLAAHFRPAEMPSMKGIELSHGLAGPCVTLAEFVRGNMMADRASAVLHRLVAYMHARAEPLLAHPPEGATSWCRGTLGAATALAHVAQIQNDPTVFALARGLAEQAVHASQPIQANFCHGNIGNAHLFHRFYAHTGETLFADAACTCIERGLNQAIFVGAVAEDRLDYLTGRMGMALALATALTGMPPLWTRFAGLPE